MTTKVTSLFGGRKPLDEPPDFRHAVDASQRGGSPRPKRKMELEWFDHAASLALWEPENPLIEDVLDNGAMSVLYGDSNAGKTFVALDMAYSVATGRKWNRKKVKRGLVVYVCAEGGSRIRRRLLALRKQNLANPNEPLLALVPYPIDLRSSDADANELLALIRSAEEERGERCTWIIVDTLSRALAGGDENSPIDMGRIVQKADYIRAETGAHFTYVHHTGKDAARGARGHSLLRAATDTAIETSAGAIKVTKQRDMEGGEEWGFSLVDVILDDEGATEKPKKSEMDWHEASDQGQGQAKKQSRDHARRDH